MPKCVLCHVFVIAHPDAIREKPWVFGPCAASTAGVHSFSAGESSIGPGLADVKDVILPNAVSKKSQEE
jgi:hypothetical protein